MPATSTLYPFELFRLLEALWTEDFTGSVALRALDETSMLYLVDGQVRYATTTGVWGTFPGYLLTEQIFPRPQIHTWLQRCGREQRTLEDLLLSEKILDPAAVVALKADLGSVIFASAFALNATVDIVASRGAPPTFGDLVLNPHDGIFQCSAEGLALPHLVTDVSDYKERSILRGPAFFRLWPIFKRWFDTSRLLSILDTDAPLSSLISNAREDAETHMQAFLMRETGMAYLRGEAPRPAPMSQSRAAAVITRPQPKPDAPPPRREPTQPGVSHAAVPTISGPLAPPPPSNPAHREVAFEPEAPEESLWVDPSESFADLRGSLVGSDLIDAADRARGQDCYAFLGLEPAAPLSEIRAAWQAMRRRYDNDRYQSLMLRGGPANALRELQKRTEAAYDTLTDLRRRHEHDERFGLKEAMSREMLEDVFYAEGLFKAAQIRLTEEQYAEAAELLDEAFIRNPGEPEYLSYLAFTIFTGRAVGVEVGAQEDGPRELLERALASNPKLESAWLFRARIEDQKGRAPQAMGAYMMVIEINPTNDEARVATRAFREAGVSPAGRFRRGLAQRLGRLLTGRASP